MAKATAVRTDESGTHVRKKQQTNSDKQATAIQSEQSPLTTLQNQIGNAAVQRLLAQRNNGEGASELDDATANRINSARGGGQALDGAVQTQMGQSMGADFSGVRVHTGNESNELNQQLGAKAFTTGQDVFFRDGEYNPSSGRGKELIAHELTHVVQQSSGTVPSGGGGMQVNAPGDQFEQEADSVAKAVTSGNETPSVQRQEMDDKEVMPKLDVQRQEEDKELIQNAPADEQEEPALDDGEMEGDMEQEEVI